MIRATILTAVLIAAAPAFAQPAFKKGTDYEEVRARLDAAGWHPHPAPQSCLEGDPRYQFCNDRWETIICRGTGRATCEFQFVKNRKQGVIVTTVGEELPLRFDSIRKMTRKELEEALED